MIKNERPGTNLRPSAAPSRPAQLDSDWDDETVPGLDLDDPLNEFDRVTAVPEVPSEQYVKSVMEAVEDSRVPAPGTPPPQPPPLPARPGLIPALAADEYFSLDSEPPPSPRSADSTARYEAIHPNNAPTARPAAFGTAAPLAPPFSLPALELAELDGNDRPLSTGQTVPVPKHLGPGDPLDDSPIAVEHGEAAAAALGTMKDRYAMGDFSGALAIAEEILEADPADLEAPRYVQSCRDVLTQMYSARLGSLDRVVVVAVPSDQIRWLTLDHRAGFLLSLIDGRITVDQILDISGMPRLDALRIMYQLLDQRVISIGG